MKFLDEAKITIKSGNGGPGCLSFRREKYIERGGPDGGNGGRGGDVRVVCQQSLNTLIDYRYQQHFRAKSGHPGMGKNRHGHKGADVVLKVPPGTQILSEDKSTVLVDICSPEGDQVLLHGGRGGMGNAHFKSSTNRAPRQTQPGEKGEEIRVWLQLKTIADVGLIGRPNAGKSMLLTQLSRAKPKVAPYPFTTLRPHLGVLRRDHQSLVVADIPGLIDGAHEGTGLGDRFLKHSERCRLLLFVIGCDDPDPRGAYAMLRRELELYNPDMLDKPHRVLLSKSDLLTDADKARFSGEWKDVNPLILSSFTGEGLEALQEAILDLCPNFSSTDVP